MKNNILQIFIVVSAFLSFFYGYYLVKGSIYLPHLTIEDNRTEFNWSDFYTSLPYEVIDEPIDTYAKENSWLMEFKNQLEQDVKQGIASEHAEGYLNYLNSMWNNGRIRLDINTGKFRTIIYEGEYNGRKICPGFPMVKESGKYQFGRDVSDQSKLIANRLGNLCKNSDDLSKELKKTTYSDFLYYTVLSCFGGCQRVGDIYVEKFTMSEIQKNELTKQLRSQMIIDAVRYKDNLFDLSHIDLEVIGMIGSPTKRYVSYNLKRPRFGMVTGYSEFDYDGSVFEIKSIYKKTDLVSSIYPAIDKLLNEAKDQI